MADNNTHPENVTDHLILFDGVCNLCNASIRFIIRHDAKERFLFAPLQSELAENIMDEKTTGKESSIIYIEKGKSYRESTAALRITRLLRFPVNLLYAFIIFPPFIRDPVYRFIARNRYRWFGKQDQCMIPSKDLSHRFPGQ